MITNGTIMRSDDDNYDFKFIPKRSGEIIVFAKLNYKRIRSGELVYKVK